jgi:hypothetical protein
MRTKEQWQAATPPMNTASLEFIRAIQLDAMRSTNPNQPIATGIERMVCDDVAQRQQKGVAKYGLSVAENPLTLREWLNHAYEECLDQAVYLRRAIYEIDHQVYGNQTEPTEGPQTA